MGILGLPDVIDRTAVAAVEVTQSVGGFDRQDKKQHIYIYTFANDILTTRHQSNIVVELLSPKNIHVPHTELFQLKSHIDSII
jgi:hypothetical protein